MDATTIPLLFVGFIILAGLIRIVAGSFDGERVEEHIREMGCELIDKSWDPFGPGWFGDNNSRIYEIVYRDQVGQVHRAHVKTSMLSGVYLTNDRVVEEMPELSADEEKAALRKRLAELEQE